MTKKIKVVLTCFKQTSYEDYTHFFKTVEIEVPCEENEEISSFGVYRFFRGRRAYIQILRIAEKPYTSIEEITPCKMRPTKCRAHFMFA